MQVSRIESSVVPSFPGNAAAFSGSKAVSRVRGYELISIAFAIVLLCAAVLKGRLLASWEGQLLMPSQRAIDTAAALIEFLLAIWILSGLARF